MNFRKTETSSQQFYCATCCMHGDTQEQMLIRQLRFPCTTYTYRIACCSCPTNSHKYIHNNRRGQLSVVVAHFTQQQWQITTIITAIFTTSPPFEIFTKSLEELNCINCSVILKMCSILSFTFQIFGLQTRFGCTCKLVKLMNILILLRRPLIRLPRRRKWRVVTHKFLWSSDHSLKRRTVTACPLDIAYSLQHKTKSFLNRTSGDAKRLTVSRVLISTGSSIVMKLQ